MKKKKSNRQIGKRKGGGEVKEVKIERGWVVVGRER